MRCSDRAVDLASDTVATWQQQRPDLDFGDMETVLLLAEVARALAQSLAGRLEPLGLSVGEFDVLATIRRHGPRATLTPTEIARLAMVSPSGLTHRLTRLEERGLVERTVDTDDRRSSRVRLTRSGRAAADRGIEQVVELDGELLAPVAPRDRPALERACRSLLASALGSPPDDPSAR